MSIGTLISVIYVVIGLLCSYHWFKEDYEEEYNKTKDEEGEVEKGMVGILLLMMAAFWLPILIYKIVKAL